MKPRSAGAQKDLELDPVVCPRCPHNRAIHKVSDRGRRKGCLLCPCKWMPY
jgi:hypothetical protein